MSIIRPYGERNANSLALQLQLYSAQCSTLGVRDRIGLLAESRSRTHAARALRHRTESEEMRLNADRSQSKEVMMGTWIQSSSSSSKEQWIKPSTFDSRRSPTANAVFCFGGHLVASCSIPKLERRPVVTVHLSSRSPLGAKIKAVLHTGS